MSKARTRILNRDPIGTLRSQLEDLQRKKQTLEARRSVNDETRQANVLEAVNGEATARGILNQVHVDALEIDRGVDELELAIQTVQREIDHAEAEAREKERLAMRAQRQTKIEGVLKARLELARQIEAALRQLAVGLDGMDTLGKELAALREEMIGKVADHTHSGLISIERSMRSMSISSRAIDFAARLDLHKWFGFDTRAGSVRTGPESFAVGEAELQRRFIAALDAEDARGAPAPEVATGTGTNQTWL